MTNKELFIKEMEESMDGSNIELSEKAMEFFSQLKEGKVSTTGFTENGKKILIYMQENYEKHNNIFKSKEIGEGLFLSGRSVSGSMRKLVTDGYVEKISVNPIAYGLTDLGKDYKFDN